MSKFRRAAKVDANQMAIVIALRAIPKVTVQLSVDDILVGYKGVNYWFEIKSKKVTNKAGKIQESAIKDSQKKLRADWQGQYDIVSSLDEILKVIGL